MTLKIKLKISLRKLMLITWSIVILVLLGFIFQQYNKERVAKKIPVLIHKAGQLYKISDQIYFKRCSTDGLDHFDLTDIDTKTFQSINDVYVKDKNTIWNLGITQACRGPLPLTLIPNVDIDTFFAFTKLSFMAKDTHSMIYNDHRLFSPSTSTVYLGFNYYKDGNKILRYSGYSDLIELKGISPDAKPVSINYLVDTRNVYDASTVYRDTDSFSIIPDADPVSFKELTNGYSLDKNKVYFKSKYVAFADPLNFTKVDNQDEMDEHCNYSYWKDKQGVFLRGKRIESADPNSFKVIKYQGGHCNRGQYSVDKNHVFYNDALLKDVDVSTFSYKGGLIISDAKNIYVEGLPCLLTDTLITSANFGYSLIVPKGWQYNFQPEYGRDHFFNCVTEEAFTISYKTLVSKLDYSKDENIVNKLLLNSVNTRRTFESMGKGGGGYEYEIKFPQHKSLFVATWEKTIDELPFLSSLNP